MNRGTADIGMIGLGVMGRNLVLNLSDRGWHVSVFNRSTYQVDVFLEGEGAGRSIVGCHGLEEFISSLKRPRIVMLMIKAGAPVDSQIESIVDLLEPGDIVIDGGNSLFTDTERRCRRLAEVGVHFVGCGVSGGEEGARWGPSLMPGGDAAAWSHLEPIFTSIAARADGEPTAAWLGPGGAGHYVKMVHNGIEYGDMQVIAEAHDVMRRGLGMSAAEQQRRFASWNLGKLDSYLIEITAEILGHREPDGTPTVDIILDAAGQKGTGKWTIEASLDQGIPVTLMAEAVYARMISSLYDERQAAAEHLGDSVAPIEEDREVVIADLHDALYGSKIVSYTQGFMLMSDASSEFDWDLDLGTIAGLWRAGCIIRSHFLVDITAAYRSSPSLRNLLFTDYFVSEVESVLPGWRRTVTRAVAAGIPVPTYASALAFYDSYRSRRLPANLIQAQRDFFGAHMYERIDRPRGEFFHTEWTNGGVDAGTAGE
jgi:6-phosphogluconate dehydrogenase